MTEVRELGPADAPPLVDLYDESEWFADRSVDDVRAALQATAVAVGVETDADDGGASRPVAC